MKKNYFYFSFILALVWITMDGTAQVREVQVSPGEGTLNEAIKADTTATGERNDPDNTVYVLQRGGEYLIDQRIENPGFQLTIVAKEGDGARPVLRPWWNPEKEKSQRPFHPRSSLTLKGLYITGLDTQTVPESNNHIIRGGGDNDRFVIEDCHLDMDWSSAVRLDGENMKMYITNCIISNISDPLSKNQLKGRAFRINGDFLDSLVVKNTTIYNIQNNILTMQENGVNHYVEFDHCTFVNIGRSTLDLKQTIKSKITNNLFVNCGFFGSETADDTVYAFALDPLGLMVQDSVQVADISHNNIYIDPALIEALPGNINKVVSLDSLASIYADMETIWNVEVAFTNPPPSVEGMIVSLYADPTTGVLFEEVGPNPDHDFGYANTFLASAGSDGEQLGDLRWTATWSTSVEPVSAKKASGIRMYPVPATSQLTISFNVEQASSVRVEVFNMVGQRLADIENRTYQAGSHSINWDIPDSFESGLYVVRMKAGNTSNTAKLIIE